VSDIFTTYSDILKGKGNPYHDERGRSAEPSVTINIPNWDHVPKVTRHIGKLSELIIPAASMRLWVGSIYKQRWDWA
jgi:hypothetical protein